MSWTFIFIFLLFKLQINYTPKKYEECLASVPTIYESCIRGTGTGFWKSVDGGVNWTRYFVAPSGASRQDYYPPVVDPYDENHLLMAGHEQDSLVESIDGGQHWTAVSIDGRMLQNGGTAAIF